MISHKRKKRGNSLHPPPGFFLRRIFLPSSEQGGKICFSFSYLILSGRYHHNSSETGEKKNIFFSFLFFNGFDLLFELPAQ
jgi:hypothetical protein